MAVPLLVGLVAVARPARAVEDPEPDLSLENTVQAGPFHLSPFFVIKDFGYDDNVRLGAERRTGDYTLTLGPGARAVVPFGRRAALSIWDEIDYAVFARESDLNHVNNSLRSKLHFYLGDVTLFADGQQDSIRERPNTEVDFRIRTTVSQGRFGMSWRPSDRGRLDLYTTRAGFRYDAGKAEVAPGGNEAEAVFGDLVAETLRREEGSVVLEGRARIRPRTSFLLNLTSGRIDFRQSSPQRDSSSASIMGGLEFDPTGSVRGFVKLGYKHLSPDSDGVDGYSGLVADASMSARILGRGELRAAYQRNTGFSVLGDNLYYLQDVKALSYEHYFNSRISVEAGRRFERSELPIPITNADTCRAVTVTDPVTGATRQETRCDEEIRIDDIVADTLSVRYRLGPSLRVGLAVGLWKRDSTFDFEDAGRGTFSTLVEYTP